MKFAETGRSGAEYFLKSRRERLIFSFHHLSSPSPPTVPRTHSTFSPWTLEDTRRGFLGRCYSIRTRTTTREFSTRTKRSGYSRINENNANGTGSGTYELMEPFQRASSLDATVSYRVAGGGVINVTFFSFLLSFCFFFSSFYSFTRQSNAEPSLSNSTGHTPRK